MSCFEENFKYDWSRLYNYFADSPSESERERKLCY